MSEKFGLIANWSMSALKEAKKNIIAEIYKSKYKLLNINLI